MTTKRPPTFFEDTAVLVTRWIGSLPSLAVHTGLFAASFVAAYMKFVPVDEMLLILTTIVSLEAIYLAIFIQMSVNRATQVVEEVSEDVDEIQEDVSEIQKDVDEMQEDVEEIQKDVDELQEDVEELGEEEKEEEREQREQEKTLTEIHADLRKLLGDVERLEKQHAAARK